MEITKRYNSEFARREIIKNIFKDMSKDNYRSAEHLIVELQQIARDAARNERLRAQR